MGHLRNSLLGAKFVVIKNKLPRIFFSSLLLALSKNKMDSIRISSKNLFRTFYNNFHESFVKRIQFGQHQIGMCACIYITCIYDDILNIFRVIHARSYYINQTTTVPSQTKHLKATINALLKCLHTHIYIHIYIK